MSYLLNNERIILGTDYYPEHWDPSMWATDLDRMLEAGIKVVRVAEFSWNKFEPREGEYTWDFFDGFLQLCEQKGMKVIFCTPTATPPAWMTDKYPEVLNARQDGVLYRHGGRRHYNYNSPIYQRFVKNIVERMAQHYAQHPSVIGWQLDNEINCEKNEFYSMSDVLAFREFLKEKYGSIDSLNQAWGTAFWNQTYTSWGEVYVPRTTNSDNTNPHEVLDYKRFVSKSACRFAKIQSDILRRYIKPGDFITTNGIFGNLNNHRLVRESLDFMTYDSYPNMAYGLHAKSKGTDDLGDRASGKSLDEVRSLKGIFGIMEQQSGANGWTTGMESPTPRPGQITLWTMQSIAHGADYIGYFRWRTCIMGTEIYWHGILDYSGRENRRIREIRDIHEKVDRIGEVAGAVYQAGTGIVRSYDNQFDSELDVWHGALEEGSQRGLYTALQLSHTPVDYVYLREGVTQQDLLKYRLLIYPHAVILSKEEIRLLSDYVYQGGILLLGCRGGLKDESGKCVQEELPGLLRDLAGVEVAEFTLVAPDEGTVYADWDGVRIPAPVFNEELEPLQGTRVLAVYDNSYYKGVPALTEHSYGKGKVLYFGGTFNYENAAVFLDKLGAAEPYRELVSLPPSCEITVRQKGNESYVFVLNYSKEEQSILLKHPVLNLYTGEEICGTMVLRGYETLVIKTDHTL